MASHLHSAFARFMYVSRRPNHTLFSEPCPFGRAHIRSNEVFRGKVPGLIFFQGKAEGWGWGTDDLILRPVSRLLTSHFSPQLRSPDLSDLRRGLLYLSSPSILTYGMMKSRQKPRFLFSLALLLEIQARHVHALHNAQIAGSCRQRHNSGPYEGEVKQHIHERIQVWDK